MALGTKDSTAASEKVSLNQGEDRGPSNSPGAKPGYDAVQIHHAATLQGLLPLPSRFIGENLEQCQSPHGSPLSESGLSRGGHAPGRCSLALSTVVQATS